MQRNIPNLNMPILRPLLGYEKKPTEKRYLSELEKFEIKCEKSFKETLGRLGIQSTVKTDRYSLPHKGEVVKSLYGESYINGPYEFYRVARDFVKELLEKNVYKIRFYILIDVEMTPGFPIGKVTYRLRYYPH